ncbi:MAG TPA: polysaccharide lyase family 7 protein, partial [Pseudonocardia sp.]
MVLPSALINLAAWKLTLPIGSKGKPTEIKQPDLATYSNTDYCCVPSEGGVRFRAPVNGGTTPNSKNCRSELREMKADGKTLASWSSTDGLTHSMFQDMAFTRLPTGNEGVGVVGGQIHDADDDIAVWRCETSGLWLALGDHREDWKLVDPGYRVGTRISTAFVVSSGRVVCLYMGREVHRFDAVISGCYFRAGAYTQANAGAKPNDAINFGEAVYYGLEVTHGPVPVEATSTPQPVPAITPTIMIIRHGEKPASKDDHTLSPKGQQRALAIRDRGLFTTPRVDLYRPTYVFSSKGQTTSMRMLQTAQPTAEALHLPIDTSLDTENAVDATAKLLVKQARAGQVVLAVLEHSAVPAT